MPETPERLHHLPARATLLVLDASSTTVEAGILRDGAWAAFERSTGEALESIFRLTRDVLARANTRLADLDGIAWCRGPGSILGMRLGAMAIEGWRATAPRLADSIWNAHSLHMAALDLAARHDLDTLEVFSDFRKGSFIRTRLAHGTLGAPELIDATALAAANGAAPASTAPRFYFRQRRIVQEPPPGATLFEYTLERLPHWNRAPQPGAFARMAGADVWVPQQPEFAQWSAERHR